MSKEIELTKGYIALVDDEDYEYLIQFKWMVNSLHKTKPYAQRVITNEQTNKKTFITMHRDLINPKEHEKVDHINGNGLDNRRINLRICTSAENNRNVRKSKRSLSSIFKGVKKVNSKRVKYQARIKLDNIEKHIGTFSNEVAAANAYNYYAKLLFGEFANLNDVIYMDKEEWEKYSSKYKKEIYKIKDIECNKKKKERNRPPYKEVELKMLNEMFMDNVPVKYIAETLNRIFHQGRVIRNENSVYYVRRKIKKDNETSLSLE